MKKIVDNANKKYLKTLIKTNAKKGNLVASAVNVLELSFATIVDKLLQNKNVVLGAQKVFKEHPELIEENAESIFTFTDLDTPEEPTPLMLSYDWGRIPEFSNIPLGVLQGNIYSVDFTKGDVLIVNDTTRNALHSMLAGLTRIGGGSMFVGINDKYNILTKWNKQFAYICKNKQDNQTVIQALLSHIDDYDNNILQGIFIPQIFLVIDNINELITEDNLELVEDIKTILTEGKSRNVIIVASCEKKGYNKVKETLGSLFEYHIGVGVEYDKNMNIKEIAETPNLHIKTSTLDTSIVPFIIKNNQISSLLPNTENILDSEYLMLDMYRLFIIMEEKINKGTEISDEVLRFIITSLNPNVDIHKLSQEYVKEFIDFITSENNEEVYLLFSKKVENMKAFIIALYSQINKVEDIIITIPTSDSIEEELEFDISEMTQIYSDDDLDNLVKEAIEEGLWQDFVKLSDEDLAAALEMYDDDGKKIEPERKPVNIKPENNKQTVSNEYKNVEPVKEEKIETQEEPTTSKTETFSPDKESKILMVMKATGMSREEVIEMLRD